MTENNPQHNWYAVIPASILLDKTLSSTQKLLLALISNLSNDKGYCYASNSYLGECLNIRPKYVSETVSLFVSMGILKRSIVRNKVTKVVEQRHLKFVTLPRKNSIPLPKKQDTLPLLKQESNNKLNNKYKRDELVKIVI